MYGCLRQAALRERDEVDAATIKEGSPLFVSSDCPLCIENVPLAVRGEKDPNDIEIGKGEWVSVADAVRYLLKSKPAAKTMAPMEVRRRIALEAHSDPTAKHMAAMQFQQREGQRGRTSRSVNWRG